MFSWTLHPRRKFEPFDTNLFRVSFTTKELKDFHVFTHVREITPWIAESTDQTYCLDNQPDVTKKVVKSWCDAKRSCYLEASRRLFVGPCGLSVLGLRVGYDCVDASSWVCIGYCSRGAKILPRYSSRENNRILEHLPRSGKYWLCVAFQLLTDFAISETILLREQPPETQIPSFCQVFIRMNWATARKFQLNLTEFGDWKLTTNGWIFCLFLTSNKFPNLEMKRSFGRSWPRIFCFCCHLFSFLSRWKPTQTWIKNGKMSSWQGSFLGFCFWHCCSLGSPTENTFWVRFAFFFFFFFQMTPSAWEIAH